MKFNLDRDLVFFDLESTGLNVIRDRIIQIACVKYPKDGSEPQELEMLINPGIPISLEAMMITGIEPKHVARKPTFQQVAKQIYEFIGKADLAGYNSNRFDIPLLMEEFARVGINFSMKGRRTLDMQRIFYKMEPRTLKAALKFYSGKEMENAHNALADVYATIDVFKGQLKKYEGMSYEGDDGLIENAVANDMQKIHEFTTDARFVDATQKLRRDVNGDVVFNFGKYQNQVVGEVLSKDQNYYHWIMNKEFSSQVKQTVKQLVKEYGRKKRE